MCTQYAENTTKFRAIDSHPKPELPNSNHEISFKCEIYDKVNAPSEGEGVGYNQLIEDKEMQKNRTSFGLSGLLAASMVLTGCATGGGFVDGSTGGVSNRDLIGGGAGAVVGYLGCRVLNGSNGVCALAAVGAAAGGVIVARRLKRDDREPRAVALAEVVEGQSVSQTWKAAETGSSGTITLVGSSTNAAGQACQTVEETYTIRGEAPITEQFELCRNDAGEWKNA